MMNEQSPSTIRAFREIEKRSGGKARYYEHVDVLTLNGVPVAPDMTRLSYTILLSDHNIIDICFTANTIKVMLDAEVVHFIKFAPKNDWVRVHGDNLLKIDTFEYVQDRKFIETPTVRYYNRYTFELYNEHFELVDHIYTNSSFMRPIKSLVQFDKFSVTGDCVLDYTDLKHDGKYIYIGDIKYALAFRGNDNYLMARWSIISVRHINKCEVARRNIPENLINRDCYRYVYLYKDQYFGKTDNGEIIGLYPRSENSGGRTKPAIRQMAEYEDA